MRLDHVSYLQIEVSNLDRSFRWYRRMLGLVPAGPGRLKGGLLLLSLVEGTVARARAFRFGVACSSRREVRAWRAHQDNNAGMPTPITEREGRYGFTIADPDSYVLEFFTAAPEEE
ncbi:MAG: VOC family protein [Armatimonadetes bacterium]|nr:VOC family protein [Armatimonadota bacterium]